MSDNEPVTEPAGAVAEPVEARRPLLRIVSGDPTPEELAALVAVVAARQSLVAPSAPTTRSEWNHPTRLVRREHRHGPDLWRRSAFGG